MVISGVIRPPPEIRAVADRTALYVSKNGRAFEQRILGSEKGKTPKFAFLQPTSPFHAYYEDRIQYYENGGEDDDPKKKENDLTNKNKSSDDTKQDNTTTKFNNDETPKQDAKSKKQTASVIDPIAKALLNQRNKISQIRSALEESVESKNANNDDDDEHRPNTTHVSIPPPSPLQFVTIVAPSSLSIAQIESIQLVAQFVALDGKGGSFLQQLTYREWNNPLFAFCHPRHGHFPYFTALVDAYRQIRTVWSDPSGTDRTNPVRMMANNVEHCLERSAYRAEYEQDQEQQARKRTEAGVADGVAKIDWHDFVVVETIDFPPEEAIELSMLPPPPPPPPEQTTTQQYNNDTSLHETMDESDDDEPIRVVPSYKPRIVTSEDHKMETVIDPITGKSVPVKDMPEHMRIQLLDPKWAEERKKFQEKQKESNLVSGDVVASNLERFAQARGDRFGKKVSSSMFFCNILI